MSQTPQPPLSNPSPNPSPSPSPSPPSTLQKRGRGRPPKLAASAASTSSSTSSSSARVTRLSVLESARKTRSSSVAKGAVRAGNINSSLLSKKPLSSRGKNGVVKKKGIAAVVKKGKVNAKKGKGGSNGVDASGGGEVVVDHPMTEGNDEGDKNNFDIDDDKDNKIEEDQEVKAEAEAEGTKYWLLKSEPESRMHKGQDVKFSLDDLEAADAGGAAWDGVRNVVARNNLRAMKKGDLAFFYHSNCKVPGIVGVAEIVREHSVDDSAHNPSSPYFDPKSTPAAPKWSIVHVEFRARFPKIITLKELNEYKKQTGSVLADMQTLRLSRLSVSKVTKEEWEFIMGLVEGQGGSKEGEGEK